MWRVAEGWRIKFQCDTSWNATSYKARGVYLSKVRAKYTTLPSLYTEWRMLWQSGLYAHPTNEIDGMLCRNDSFMLVKWCSQMHALFRCVELRSQMSISSASTPTESGSIETVLGDATGPRLMPTAMSVPPIPASTKHGAPDGSSQRRVQIFTVKGLIICVPFTAWLRYFS